MYRRRDDGHRPVQVTGLQYAFSKTAFGSDVEQAPPDLGRKVAIEAIECLADKAVTMCWGLVSQLIGASGSQRNRVLRQPHVLISLDLSSLEILHGGQQHRQHRNGQNGAKGLAP